MSSKQTLPTLNLTPQCSARHSGGKPYRKLVSEGGQSVFRNAKHIAINIYTAYVLYNICHVCLHLFTYISFRLSAAVSSVWDGFAFQLLLLEYLAENKIGSQRKFQHGQMFLLGRCR